MVDLGLSGASGGGGEKSPTESASNFDTNPLSLMAATAVRYNPYPPPLTTFEAIAGSREVFMDTLKKLHAAMGSKFMVPVVGGKDLDLHKLFVEVTSRGGINKVMKDRKWKDVTAVFSFPSSATNASFILRKYYISLLYHYEQMYFFKAKYWKPLDSDSVPTVSTITPPPQGMAESALSPQQTNAAALPQQQANTAVPEVSSAPLAVKGSPVCGVIDGKFESGYLITVKIGSEDFKGVLYQVSPSNEARIFPNQQNLPQMQMGSVDLTNHPPPAKLPVPRRKRRKKCEIKKRDPAHPKPNRSGYNFFFAEQHARLKPHYHGRDREISRMIGELWNKLQEPERAIYQEKALRDKERYKSEMEVYRERLKTGQIGGGIVPIQQYPPALQLNPTGFDVNLEFEGTTSAAYVEENETSSDKSDMEEDGSAGKDPEIGEFSQADKELKNVNVEMLTDEAFQLQTGPEKVVVDDKNISSASEVKDVVNAEDGISVPIEEGLVVTSNADEQVQNQ